MTAREKVILGLLVTLLVAGGAWRVLKPAASVSSPGIIEQEEGGPSPSEEPEELEMIIVHLTGAVQEPGVYRLPAGSRVFEALEMAGGFTEDADRERINLARPLFDGEQVHIYLVGENPSPGTVPAKININTATAEEMAAALPGIGEVRAQRIVEHREKHGPFTEIAEIMDVYGIGEGIFNQIKDLIAVY